MNELKISYSIQETNDTCIVMCFFSPMNYYKPLQNIKYVTACLKEAQIPYIIIELLYPDQDKKIEESIIVKSNSIIFSKENLWNIGEKHVSEKYNKILFLDSDIVFSEPSWFDSTSRLLDYNDIVQPMEYACRDITFDNILTKSYDFPLEIRHVCKHSFAKGIKDRAEIALRFHQPGFGIGMRRDFFHKISGFYEHGITGNSDVMFWLSIVDFPSMESVHLFNRIPEIKKIYSTYKNNFQKHSNIDRIDYIKNNIGFHINHGTEKNRSYGYRARYVPDNVRFYYNEYGVLEIASDESKDLREYWIDRKEDE